MAKLTDQITNHGWEGRIAGYRLTGPIPDEHLEPCITIATEALLPATEQFVIAELGRLRALTVSRVIGEDIGIVFAAYADELTRYPPDIVRQVLRSWPKHNRFWPAMAELAEQLDELTEPRKILLDTLRQGYRAQLRYAARTEQPTDEQKAEVDALLAKHGIRPANRCRTRPPDQKPTTRHQLARAVADLATFRLPDEQDPRVQRRLREMGEA